MAQNSLSILQNHYPERLGLCLIVNAPNFMYYLFKVLSFFINSVTINKIKWIYGKGEELKNKLSEFIDEDQLEVDFGGKLEPPAK